MNEICEIVRENYLVLVVALGLVLMAQLLVAYGIAVGFAIGNPDAANKILQGVRGYFAK